MSIGLVGLRGLRGLGKSGKLSNAQRMVRNLFRDGILTDVLDPGTYTQTEVRASGALGWSGETLANNTIARRLVKLWPGHAGVNEVYTERAVTRINDADITNWTATGSAAASDEGSGVYRLTMANTETIYENRAVLSARSHYLGMQARKISGDATGLTAKFVDASASTEWASIDLSGITTEWAWYGDGGTTDDTDGRCIFEAGASVVFEVRYVQLVEKSYRKRFVPGAGAGVTKSEEYVSVSVTLGDNEGLYCVTAPFQHDQDDSGHNPNALFRPSTGNDATLAYSTFGNAWFGYADGSSLSHSELPEENIKTLLGLDWDYAGLGEGHLYRPAALQDTTAIAGVPSVTSLIVGKYGTQGNSQAEGSICLLRASPRLDNSGRSALASVLGDGLLQYWEAL